MIQRSLSPTYLSGQEGHGGAVYPGIIASGRHSLQVVLTFWGPNVSTCQLSVIDYNIIPLHGLLHGNQSI